MTPDIYPYIFGSVSDYLLSSNVQLGASYPTSQKSTNLFQVGKDAAAQYINATANEVSRSRLASSYSSENIVDTKSLGPVNYPAFPESFASLMGASHTRL